MKRGQSTSASCFCRRIPSTTARVGMCRWPKSRCCRRTNWRTKREARWVWDRSSRAGCHEVHRPSGQLSWDVPAGNWKVLRIGCTLHGNAIKCVGSGPGGLEIDTMSAAAMDAHFAETGAKLIADAGPLAGKIAPVFPHRQLGTGPADLDAADARGVPAAAGL